MKHKKKLKSIGGTFPRDLENGKIKNESNKIKKKLEEEIVRNDLKYESGIYVYHFWKFQTKRFFGDDDYNGKVTIGEADQKQSNLLNIVSDFNKRDQPRPKADV